MFYCLIFCFDSCLRHFTPGQNECFRTTYFSVFVLSLWTAWIATRSFSQEILQPNFSIDSILDAIEGSDEPAPQNSCAEELKKIAPDESIKGGPKAVRVVIKMGILKPNQ